MSETKKFFEAMFANKPEDSYVIIWQTPLKTTRRFKELDKLIDFVEKIKDSPAEIYYGCGLQEKDHGERRRGKKQDIIGIPGFYIDIDIADEVHKSKNLPPTVDDAVKLVLENGFDPTIIVHTGHGIHAHWIFKEPEMFKDAAHRIAIETMCRRIQETIKQKAAKKGWTIDSTFDITRVLRIPGTFNNKNENKKPVEIIYDAGPYYSAVEDFEDFVVGEDQLQQLPTTVDPEQQQIILDNITLSPDAQAPTQKLDWLCDLDAKFKASWQASRDPKSFKSGKATPSEYALSLASIAVHAEWTDQEVANLIIEWYRRHGHDMSKALRGDYIARTLAVAKKTVEDEFVKHYKENIEPTEGTKYYDQVDPNRENTKRMISNTLKFKVLRLVKYVDDTDPSYVMHTDQKPTPLHNGKVKFKTQNELLKQEPFKMRVAAAINCIVDVPRKHWTALTQKFMLIVEEVDDPEAYTEGRIKSWLNAYLLGRRHYQKDETVASQEPFIYKNHWYVYHNHFSRWAYNKKGYLDGPNILSRDLKQCGALKKQLKVAHPHDENEKPITKRPHKIPHALVRPKKQPPKNKKINLKTHMTNDSVGDATIH